MTSNEIRDETEGTAGQECQFSEEAFRDSLRRGAIRSLADSPYLAEAYRNLARKAWAHGDWGTAHEYYLKCISLVSAGYILEKRRSSSFKEYCLSNELNYKTSTSSSSSESAPSPRDQSSTSSPINSIRLSDSTCRPG